MTRGPSSDDGATGGSAAGDGPHRVGDEEARLFVAVWPPAEVVGRLEALERPERPGVRWTGPDQWHATLRFLGQAPLRRAVDAVAAVRGAVATVQLGPVTARLGRGVLCLPAHGLDELAAAVLLATAAVGRPPQDRPFHGHLTLARAARGGGRKGRGSGRGGQGALTDLVGAAFSAAFTVGEITLVRSVPGRGGHRYEVVAAAALEGAGPRPAVPPRAPLTAPGESAGGAAGPDGGR
ncbi:MAG: hypothetical protein GEV08_14165 [Acidimicrobiia bacterium]|nr:hypothetical protein [Acidimicrobiia bacterium]